MPIALICPSCGNIATAPDDAAGCIGKCAKCGGAVKVPGTPKAPAAKICVVCHKDLTGQKRVKDEAGQYYCQPCFLESRKTGTVEAPAPVQKAAVSMQQAAGGGDDELMLKDDPRRTPRQEPLDDLPLKDDGDLPLKAPLTNPRPAPAASDELALADDLPLKNEPPKRKVAPRADAAPASSATAPLKLPDKCPNCGTPVFKKDSRLCVKCGRDLTRMDALLKIQADAARGPTREEKVGAWMGMTVKYGLWAFLAFGVVLGAWVIYTMFNVPDPYPKSRVQVVKDFLGFVAKGDERSLEKAWGLVSIRVKSPERRDIMISRFKKMAEEFKSKYGAGWDKKVNITPPATDTTDFGDAIVIRIDKDRYDVYVDPQTSAENAVINMASHKVFKEDGKLGFGIANVEFYELEPPKKRYRKTPADVNQGFEMPDETRPAVPGLPADMGGGAREPDDM